MNDQLTQKDLYESVKSIVESDEKLIQLNQHKLYTLFSIAFQYMLFRSTKKPGNYIIRLEDNYLATKLARKAKDESTRRFMQSLLLPRKWKFQGSCFYLDFFNINTWNLTKDLDPDRIEGALIVKNSTKAAMIEIDDDAESDQLNLPTNYYYSTLIEVSKKSIFINYEEQMENFVPMRFSFIKDKEPELAHGVKISTSINLDATE